MYYLILMPCRLCMKSEAQGSQFIVCNNSSLKFPCIWLWMKATGTYLVKFRYEKLGLSRNEWVDRERLFKRRPNFEAGGLVLNHHICLIKGISFFSPRVQGNSNVVLYTFSSTCLTAVVCSHPRIPPPSAMPESTGRGDGWNKADIFICLPKGR